MRRRVRINLGNEDEQMGALQHIRLLQAEKSSSKSHKAPRIKVLSLSRKSYR